MSVRERRPVRGPCARIAEGAPGRRGGLILLRKLNLTNFRNYTTLELALNRGVTLIEGPNGRGKTNLLESIHLLSIGRSPRTSLDREMIRSEALGEPLVHMQVVGQVSSSSGDIRLQVDLSGSSESVEARNGAEETGPRIQKTFRVNGVPRRASDFVGLSKSVLFGAEDLDLTGGPPSLRRRYADLLVSQLTDGYLRDLQEYQRVLTQRNFLLKSVREGRSNASELDFWDIQFSIQAARIMAARSEALSALSRAAEPIHKSVGGSDGKLSVMYVPSVTGGAYSDVRELSKSVLDSIREQQRREIAAGFSLVGPHRDDLSISIGGREVGTYGSRGQSRTAVLAMRLAEVDLLSERSADQPVLLLDDVLSELDPIRRSHVVDRVSTLEQVIVTTAERDVGRLFGNQALSRLAIGPGANVAAV